MFKGILTSKAYLLFLLLNGLSISAQAVTEPFPEFDQVQLEKTLQLGTDQVVDIVGKPYVGISVYAVQEGHLAPIPFQFEEYDDKGYLFQKKSKHVDKASIGVFDNNDLLVLMLKDTGVKASPDQLKDLDVISELNIENESTSSYFYLVRNGDVSDKSYVSFDEKTGLITMPGATIQMNPKDILDWGDIIPRDFGDKSVSSIMDSLKIRISGKFFRIPFKLDNKNLQGKLRHVYHGPIRLTLDAKIRAIVMKIPLIRISGQLQVDYNSAKLFINMSTPSKYSKMIKDPNVIVAIDGHELYDGFVRTSVSGDQSYLVDGKMSEEEVALNNIPIDDDVSWIWLSSKDDFNIIGQFDIGSSTAAETPELYTDIEVFYRDDKSLIDKPERFDGALPSLGYQISSLPETDTTRFSYKVLFLKNMQPLNAGQYLDKLDERVVVSNSSFGPAEEPSLVNLP